MRELPKQFDFKEEAKIYKLWEESSFFNPDNIDSKEKYCNVLPPPNANGELHIGHASGHTVMDIFGRYNRMKGKKTLLLPGKDHAGILTQVVYERKIKEEQGKSRYDLGREKFYQGAYDFCLDRADYMRSQEKALGMSADWSREKFTLDPEISKTVLKTFVKMYEDGMIYKGKRIINWCPRCATALSDLEVIHKESDGKLWYIKYPIKDSDSFIIVATTRPETMLGDSAVAVNPKDERYKNLVGKSAVLPLMDREIPIIADPKVDFEFGTGAVKITPAHDPLDWKIGKEHKLEEIQVINEQAEITELGGKYVGQNTLEARQNILKDLKKLGLLEKEDDLKNNISICERCKSVIEPLISDQWFINVDAKKYSIKKKCLEAIKNNEINFYPENFKEVMIRWFENLNDWCISRQIWWGHRIPVWYPVKSQGDNGASKSDIYVGLEAPESAGWIQDEDTFDTWFSSGQWAYTTLGYPKGKDFKEFYPTDTMIMGRDILFFWACRMIIISLYRTQEVPFKNLYFTGLVLDKNGQKMSKSKNNGINPLEMTEKFGTDALRLSLISGTAPGQDFRLYEEKIAGFRNFVTKLWNITRYAMQADENFELVEEIKDTDLISLSDKFIVSKLEETKGDINKYFEEKNISLAIEKLRQFTWDDLADWYLEIHKLEKNSKVLGYVLNQILKLWHPFVPFVTESIWQSMVQEKLLMIEKWPEAQKELVDKKAVEEFENLKNIIGKIRNLRSSYHIELAKIIDAYGIENIIIAKLVRVKFIGEKTKKKLISISSGKIKIGLDISGIIDVQKELANIKEGIRNLEDLMKKNEKMLKNKNFIANASESVILATKTRIGEYNLKINNLKESENGLLKL